ncbi:uncharacterized protein ISCGN_008663 [Ixodes scapularis]
MSFKREQFLIDSIEFSVEATGDRFWVTRHSVTLPYEDISPRFERTLRLAPVATNSDVNSAESGPETPLAWPVVRNSAWPAGTRLVDERLFWSTIIELSRSHNYRRLCFQAVQRRCRREHCLGGPLHLSFRMQLVPWNAVMDKSWDVKLGYLVAEQVELENAMAWLSTLGGAYSALGDNNVKFAEAASQVSVQQLKLALRIGDPATLCRCRIYIAMSLLQRGYFRSCRRLLRPASTKAGGKSQIPEFRIVELQGDLVTHDSSFLGKYIGDLHYTKAGVPVLLVGHHVLYGKEQKVEKPFLVMRKVMQESASNGTSKHTAREYHVEGVVTKKLVFRARPKPIVSNPLAKV